jgi:DNA-3-methyladenine glycosylase
MDSIGADGPLRIDTAPLLPRHFFARDTLAVARSLLGIRLVRALDGQRVSGIIVECEAYIGQADTACHASHGRTARNEVMFGLPGHAYVYFTYGMHWMLNVVAEPEGSPAAVLIRALQPMEGVALMRVQREARGRRFRDEDLTNGPAKLTQALAIDRALNGADLVHGQALWLERGEAAPDEAVASGPRIGINYAAEQDRQAPWRFWLRGNLYVSRP